MLALSGPCRDAACESTIARAKKNNFKHLTFRFIGDGVKMLFYVIRGPKVEGPPPAAPPKEFMELVVKEWQHVIDLMDKGKVAAAYAYIDKPGGFIVCDVESREDLDELLMTLPMHPYSNFQITPLITAPRAIQFDGRARDKITPVSPILLSPVYWFGFGDSAPQY